jgi:DNA gyrase subunit B
VLQQTTQRGTPTAISNHRHHEDGAARRSPSSRHEIFETTVYSFDTLAQRLRELAFLNGGIVITLDDERDGKKPQFPLRRRHRLVRAAPEQEQGGGEREADLHARREGRHRGRNRAAVERRLRRNVYSFANNINTHEGGTHLSGFRAALTRTHQHVRDEEQPRKDLKESVTGDDIREG